VRSAPFADAPSYFGGQLPVLEKQLDERADDFLAGDSGEPQAVRRVSLPDVQGPVGGGRQIDGPSGALAARLWLGPLLVDVLPEAREAFGLRRGVSAWGRMGPKRWRAGFHAAGRPSVGVGFQ
jgi:hypothetical protein